MKPSLIRITLACLLLQAISAPAVFAVVTPNPPQLQAKGYVLMDFQSGAIIAEQNARMGLAPASLTKLMTAYVVGQEIKSGRLGWEDTVTISENAWSAKFPDSSKMFIQPKDEITISNLMRGVIVQSGNDACVALAEHVAGSESAFVALMNGWAEKLNLQDTYFVNSHGLDSDGIQTSPTDMAVLMQSIINDVPDVYAIYSEKVFKWNKITQYNRNKLLWDNSIDVDGGKTGYTSKAGYSLVSSAKEGQMRLISVVMGAPSKRSRISQSKNLLSYGFRFYDTKQVATQGEVESTAKVWKGDVSEIELGFAEDAYLTLPRSLSAGLDKTIVVNEPIIAPIEKGQVVGKVVWKHDDKTVASYPLVSNQAVAEGSWIGKLWDSLVLWVKSLLA
ncbi:D-alanyl-D-alanine carboxypeptidase family protein [Vibrio alfacsensis]|uniref:D-alanyl-D-alanine carboxypeptidase family protein n=1 Tax=Vibrio alfacsensis TaxID=1074311 RepID=UPI001BF0B028|nr:D-alanyl-D-alanine carboxypeptidase family protein [Vibrio alfacsensis]BCN26688.1 D-alanyl-D-alanine carboxypeptidase [Vibrio alfacsensis]